jgi:4-hydroxy-tetrahydrodipicolinate synthase
MLSPSVHKRAYARIDAEPIRSTALSVDRKLPAATTDVFSSKRQSLLPGWFTALATPFERDSIAQKTFANFVAWQIGQGARGLVVCSATGEAATLTPQERALLIEIAVETAARRVPIVAATGTNCTSETIALTQAAQAAGAAAALIVTPYYNKPSQEGLYRHYSEIARSVDLPLIIEIDPSHTGIDVCPETLARLADIPNIIASADAVGAQAGLADRPFLKRRDFMQLSGDDDSCVLFRLAGGNGSISIAANAVPNLWAEMHRACDWGDWGRAAEIERRLLPLLRAVRSEPSPGTIKYALSFLRPWFSPATRLPLAPVSSDTATAIVEALKGLDLIF